MFNRSLFLQASLAFCLVLLAVTQTLAEQLNDPMRPPGKELMAAGKTSKQVTASRYRLDSIIIAPNRRQAIINGRQLTPGESIGGAKLIDVQATQVTLLVGGKSHVLTLLPLSIKMPSEATRQ